MKSGQVSQRVHNMWVTAGIFTEKQAKNLSCNIIRKSTSTGLKEIKSTNLQEVADLMKHRKNAVIALQPIVCGAVLDECPIMSSLQSARVIYCGN